MTEMEVTTGLPGVLGQLAYESVTPPPAIEPRRLGGGGLTTPDGRSPKWAKVLDQTLCIGCHACTTACKSENEVPVGVSRTYVKAVDTGFFPQTHRAFQVTRCNMCEDAPCVAACPTSAMYQRADGIVDFDKSICIGCKACIAACPYDAIFINPEDHSAEKCNFCSHRLEVGLEPACAVVCPVGAIIVGDMNDPDSRVSQVINRKPVSVRRPEKETKPKVYYSGASEATLDPLAARGPEGDTYMWSQIQKGHDKVVAGHPAQWNNSSAAAILSYDVAHRMPWDWRVSLYTWTKAIAAGVYLVPLILILAGVLGWGTNLLEWAAPVVGLGFLGITGALLVWDLSHPLRFYLIFTKPQWRSWLVRGAFIIAGYGVVLSAQLLAAVMGSETLSRVLAYPGVPLGLMTAVYTAYLFAQSKARDLWQNPLLPAHMAVQMVMAGSAVCLLLAPSVARGATDALAVLLSGTAVAHLMMTWGDLTLSHPTAHAHLAAWEMTRGRFAPFFWAGIVLVGLGAFAFAIGVWAAPFALIGLLAHEHAYVQAAQAVPLA